MPLKSLADIQEGEGPGEISNLDGPRVIFVEGNAITRRKHNLLLIKQSSRLVDETADVPSPDNMNLEL